MVDFVTVAFKVDVDTRDAMVQAASAEGRSLSEFMRYWMQLSFCDEIATAAPRPKRPGIRGTPISRLRHLGSDGAGVHELFSRGFTPLQISVRKGIDERDVVAELSR